MSVADSSQPPESKEDSNKGGKVNKKCIIITSIIAAIVVVLVVVAVVLVVVLTKTNYDINLDDYSKDVKLTKSGTYTIKGSMKYSLQVDCDDSVTLSLSSVNIASSTSAAIAQIGTGELIIELEEGTTSVLSDGGSSDYDACIYSNGPMTIKGSGTLNVTGQQDDGEGIATEAQTLTISGNPTINIVSSDDGLNAGGDGDTITIEGGTLNILATGDGIDSNHDIVLKGGTIFTSANTGDNFAIDSDDGITINGGTIVAVSQSGYEKPKTATQVTMCFVLDSSVTANSVVSLTTSAGKEIVTFKTPIAFKALIISHADLAKNTVYNLYTGCTTDVTTTSYIYSKGSTFSTSTGTKLVADSSDSFTTDATSYITTFGTNSGGGGGGDPPGGDPPGGGGGPGHQN